MAENIVKIKFEPDGDKELVNAIKSLDDATKKLLNTQAKIIDSNNKNTISTKRQSDGMRRLFIQLRANNKSFKDLGLSTSVLTKAFKGNRVALAQVRNAMKKLNSANENADISTRILGGTFAVLRSKALLAGFAISTMIRPIFNFVRASASVESMSIAFNNLSGGAGNAEVALEKLRQATNNTMSSFDLFRQANNAMILGVTTNSDEMAEMFDIAQRLGRALGRDTASSVESLITGIGRQSRLMLDNIGIIVDSQKAYEDYAKANNLVASSLTDSQKKQAFFNATIESARNKVKTLGDESLTSQDALDRMSASFSNLSVALGENLGIFTRMGIAIAEFSDKIAENISKERTLADIQDEINAKLRQRKSFAGDEMRVIQKGAEIAQGIAEMNIKRIDKELSALFRERDIKTELQLRDKERLEASKKEVEAIKKTREELDRRLEKEKELDEIEKFRVNKSIERINTGEQAKNKVLKSTSEKRLEDLIKLEGQFLSNNNLTNQQLIEADKFFSEERKNIFAEEMRNRVELQTAGFSQFLGSFNQLTGAMEQDLEQRKQNELNALKSTEEFQKASAEERKNMEHQLTKSFADEEIRLFNMKKASNLAQIAIDTASAVAEALPNIPLSVIIGAMGVAQAGIVASQAPPKFQSGGLVGGRSHSQGGTLIEAERGEFVMSRNAVQSIGVEAMNQINQGNTGGLTLNVSAPLVDETVLDSIIPAIEKAQRMNLA